MHPLWKTFIFEGRCDKPKEANERHVIWNQIIVRKIGNEDLVPLMSLSVMTDLWKNVNEDLVLVTILVKTFLPPWEEIFLLKHFDSYCKLRMNWVTNTNNKLLCRRKEGVSACTWVADVLGTWQGTLPTSSLSRNMKVVVCLLAEERKFLFLEFEG